MHQLLVFLLLVCSTANGQGQTHLFIGQGSNVFIAVIMGPNEWDWGITNCHRRNLMPGIIQTENDYKIITDFLKTDTIIDIESRALWLAATDHKEEGTFQWLLNSEMVSIGSWAPGMPSENRTANCLSINKEGLLVQESCSNSGRNYYTLCQSAAYSEENGKISFRIDQRRKEYEKTTLVPTPLALSIIGQVGNRMYFVDDQLLSWTESLDLCHFAGMRLATPETPEEFQFIESYAWQRGQEGEPTPLYYLGGTDILSVDCLKTNAEFWWLYSGNPLANQTELEHNANYYQCTYIAPHGLSRAGCAKGVGPSAHVICEITI